MSNLGAYQWITSTSKKVGGPVNLLLLTGVAGAAIYKLGEMGVKQCTKAIKLHRNSKSKTGEPASKIYVVTSNGESNEGVCFAIGNRYRVLERDNESVLIEKMGDKNNPYFVSADFLRTVSNFQE